VYEGETLGGLTVITNADGFTALRGHTYFVAVDVIFPGIPSVFVLHVQEFGLRFSPQYSKTPVTGDTVQFETVPTDLAVAITRVEAWADGQSLGVQSNAPYLFNFVTTNSGIHVITAQAYCADSTILLMAANIPVKPTNDDFAGATAIPSVVVNQRFEYVGRIASIEPDEPSYTSVSTPGSLWWKWTPKYEALTTVDSGTADLYIFKGDSLTNLQFVAHSLPNRIIIGPVIGRPVGGASFTNEAGITYWFSLIPDTQEPDGQWSLRQQLHFVALSPSDSVSAGQTYTINLGGNADAPRPFQVNLLIQREIPNPAAPGLTWMTQLTTNLNPADFSWPWAPDQTGKWRLAAQARYESGETSFSTLEVEVHEANDFFQFSCLIPPGLQAGELAFATEWASTEESEPVFGTNQIQRTVWWRWTPDQNANVRLKVAGNFGGLPLEVFTGSTITNLTRLAHNDGRALLTAFEGLIPLSAMAGQTYYIRTSDPRPFPSQRNDLKLTIEPLDAPLPGLILLSSMVGILGEDGNIDWTVFSRVFDQNGAPATNFNFRAQFYVGGSLSTLSPVGVPLPIAFQSSLTPDTSAGIVSQGFWHIPNIHAGDDVFVQLRAWDDFSGGTYETARQNSGAFGRSKIISVKAGSELTKPAVLNGLGDVLLQDGIANFSPGTLTFESISLDGIKWKISGPPGFIYNIERTDFASGWETLSIVTNTTGEVTFDDKNAGQRSFSIYRAKIVD